MKFARAKMKLKYRKEDDDIIRKFYPAYGARRTAKELEKISMHIAPSQVQQRARTLHVKSLRNFDDQVQRFKIGETVTIYRIKKFLGVKKTDALFVGSVRYLVQCVVCGYEEKKNAKRTLSVRKARYKSVQELLTNGPSGKRSTRRGSENSKRR